MNYKNKSFMTKRKAFTLIELLIVIAIIGILFIVLVSKVDFATDKAKASGVQTDFRSFQMAFDTVAKENAGFNTFGWDTGDANQDGIRNSYDEGDNGVGGGIAQNGIQDGTEVFTGHKVYTETFSKVYSLKKNGTGSYDRNALNRLETAINANLDLKLHITIKDDGEIVMANGAQDPWNKEYHGWYITNAEADGLDRGAIIMYSDGANNEFGSEHSIANGLVSIVVPGNNKNGKDDYSIVSLYTYVNGYGEVQNVTTGFSNNQTMLGGNDVKPGVDTPDLPNGGDEYEMLNGNDQIVTEAMNVSFRSEANYDDFVCVKVNGEILDSSNYVVTEGSTVVTLKKEYVQTLRNGVYSLEIVSESGSAKTDFTIKFDTLNDLGFVYDQIYSAYVNYFDAELLVALQEDGTLVLADIVGGGIITAPYTLNDDEVSVTLDNFGLIHLEINDDGLYCPEISTMFTVCNYDIVIDSHYFYMYSENLNGYAVGAINKTLSTYNGITSTINGKNVVAISDMGFWECLNMTEMPQFPSTITYIGVNAFSDCPKLKFVSIPQSVEHIAAYAFDSYYLEYVVIPNNVKYIENDAIGNSSATHLILCEAQSKPDGWSSYWSQNIEVVWGYNGQTITYQLNADGGVCANELTSTIPVQLPVPVKSGMAFVGWYDNANFDGERYVSTYYHNVKTTLYAKYVTIDEYERLCNEAKSVEFAYKKLGEHTVYINGNGDDAYFEIKPTKTATYHITAESNVALCAWVQRNYWKEMEMSYNGGNIDWTVTLLEGQTYYFIVTTQDDGQVPGSINVNIVIEQ